MATVTIANTQAQKMNCTRRYYAPDLKAAISAGYVTLAKAICRQALADAIRNKDPEVRAEAAAWLMDPNGQELAELGGFNTALISRWIRAGCPAKGER